MKEITLAEFTSDTENYTVQAVRDGAFLKNRTKAGNSLPSERSGAFPFCSVPCESPFS